MRATSISPAAPASSRKCSGDFHSDFQTLPASRDETNWRIRVGSAEVESELAASYYTELILSHTHPAFGHALPRGEGSCEKMTGACGCEKFPLKKGGSAEGAGVVSRGRKAKGR
ncbi:MAG: hypothetical protein L0312_23565, partial [Acidobacteria bacterium]|nr:hypothetical protein [Acidobacteriota bacterium]